MAKGTKQTESELRKIVEEVLLENVDKIASVVASKLRVKIKDRSMFVRKANRLEFVKKYPELCSLAFITKNSIMTGISLRDAKLPAGKAIVALAREELNYKQTTYSGDIFRYVGITYLKSVGKWKY